MQKHLNDNFLFDFTFDKNTGKLVSNFKMYLNKLLIL